MPFVGFIMFYICGCMDVFVDCRILQPFNFQPDHGHALPDTTSMVKDTLCEGQIVQR